MLDILIQDNMAQQAAKQGAYLKTQLQALQKEFECIGDVRGKGLLLGVEIVKDRETKTPDLELGHQISERCLELGLSMNIVRFKGMGGVFRIAPLMTITKEEIDLGIAILEQAIRDALNRTIFRPKIR